MIGLVAAIALMALVSAPTTASSCRWPLIGAAFFVTLPTEAPTRCAAPTSSP